MAIAGLLVPEEKSRYSQVPAIEMQGGGGGVGGYGLIEKMLMVWLITSPVCQ